MSDQSLLKSIRTPFRTLPPALTVSLSILVWVLVIAGWFALTYSGAVKEMFLPRPEAVVMTTLKMIGDGSLFEHILASVQVVLIGFIVSSLVAVPLGLTMGTYRIVQAFFDPLVNFIRYLPVTSFVPLFILWIGIGTEQRVAVKIGRASCRERV